MPTVGDMRGGQTDTYIFVSLYILTKLHVKAKIFQLVTVGWECTGLLANLSSWKVDTKHKQIKTKQKYANTKKKFYFKVQPNDFVFQLVKNCMFI